MHSQAGKVLTAQRLIMSEIFVSCSEGIDGERWQALRKRSWERRVFAFLDRVR